MSAQSVAERVRQYGVASARPEELFAVGLARRATDVPGVAQEVDRLLERWGYYAEGGLGRMKDLASGDLNENFGLDEFEATRVLALLELGRRIAEAARVKPEIDIGNADAVAAYLDHLKNEKKEHLVALLLDAKNRVLCVKTIHTGTATMSVVGPREIFREAVREGATALIVAHNHPSGDPEPSREDIEVTKLLVSAGKMMEIPVLDHVVIGHHRHVSLRARGYMGQ